MSDLLTMAKAVDLFKRAIIVNRLRLCHGNAVHTAKSLGVERNSIYHWIRRYGITREERYASS